MSSSPHQHRLRLTRADGCAPVDEPRTLKFPLNAAAASTKAASASPIVASPRWAVAVRTWTLLQGTMLTPVRRRNVLDFARLMRVRAFDANLIIALVQDHARRNGTLAELNEAVHAIPVAPEQPTSPARLAWMTRVRVVLAAAGAVALFMVLARWINGG